MFIQTSDTPNADTLKFTPGVIVLNGNSFEISKQDYASGRIAFTMTDAALFRELFNIDGVESIYLAEDFISVTKNKEKSWAQVKPLVLSAIMDFFIAHGPISALVQPNHSTSEHHSDEDDEIVRQIKEIIEQNVRPAVAQDGGDIVFYKYDKGVVYVKLMGACAGCPSSTVTLKNGIENMLKYYVPEVEAVEDINESEHEHEH